MTQPSEKLVPIASYYEKSPGLRRSFALFPDKVFISAKVFTGSSWEITIPLSSVNPELGIYRFRSKRFAAGFLLSCAFIVLLWLLLGPFNYSIQSPRVIVTSVLCMASLSWSVIYFSKYTAYRFINHQGLIVLDVIEAGPQRDQCHEFAQKIAQAIQTLPEKDSTA